MIGRLIRIALILGLLALVVHRLFNRRQKQTVYFWVKAIAIGLLTASLLAVLAALLHWHGARS